MEQMRQHLAALVQLVTVRYPWDFDGGLCPSMGDRRSAPVRALRLIAHVMGAELIGIGAYRVAFLVNGVVLKVARSADGAECNLREFNVWSEASDGIRPHLVPVLDYDEANGVLTMEYASEKLAGHLGWAKRAHILDETRYAVEAELQDILGAGIYLDLHGGNVTTNHRIVDYAGMRC